MRAASKADFEDEGGLYWPPYGDRPWFIDRAAALRGRWPTGKILVVGCGWGYTVHHALGMGSDVWGCDVSPYALAKASEVLPATSRDRLLLADATAPGGLTTVAAYAGLAPGERFTAVLTEDMIGALTDAEAVACAVECRRVGAEVAHLATCVQPDEHDPLSRRDDRLTWHTRAQWADLLAPDPVHDTETEVTW